VPQIAGTGAETVAWNTARMSIEYRWRGAIENDEVNALNAEAFETGLFTADEWDWQSLVAQHSLGGSLLGKAVDSLAS